MGGMFASALGGGANRSDPQGITLREYWCKPTPSEPEGPPRRVDQERPAAARRDNPYPWLPYVMFRGIPVPGRFWPTCPTEQLISPQTELNKAQSQIAENAERIGNPPLLRSSLNEDFEWHALPGEEIVFRTSAPPAPSRSSCTSPSCPATSSSDVDRIEQSIREISGQHEVTSGAGPRRRHRGVGDQPAAGAGRHPPRPGHRRHGNALAGSRAARRAT
jgi:hypothetical protein